MKRIAIAAAAALLLLGSAQAQQARAASPWYGELGYTFLNIDSDGADASPQALRGIVGYNFHRYFAVEGMAAFGTSSDNVDVFVPGIGVVNADVKLQHSYGIFLKPKYDFGNVEVFGRVGWVKSKIKVSAFGASASDSDDDIAWGLGANYNFNPRTYVGLDYTRYFDKNGTTVNGWTINLGYRF